MATLRHAALLAASVLALSSEAIAQTMPQPTQNTLPSTQQANPGVEYKGKGEHYTARGRHSLPPGYQETPSTEFHHGPDPDHEDNIQRDSVTGADLSKFGSSFQGSNPAQSGQLGDSTGNGWVAPR